MPQSILHFDRRVNIQLHRRLSSITSVDPALLAYLVAVSIPRCTDPLQFDAVSLNFCWSLSKSTQLIFVFSLWFGHLDSDLDISTIDWTPSIGPRSPTNMHSQTLLVSLIILSHNHQDHNYSLTGPCFLDAWVWDFNRSLGLEEVQEWEALISATKGKCLNNAQDKVLWVLEKSGVYSTRSMYRFLTFKGVINKRIEILEK